MKLYNTISKWKKGTREITGCEKNVESLHIPAAIDGREVSSISKTAFRNRGDIRCVYIEDGIEFIDVKAFEDCRNLESIRLPDTLTHLASECFQRCGKLKEVILPASLLKIENRVFNSCVSLKKASAARKLRWIGEQAFCNCTSLSEFSVKAILKHIGKECFLGTQLCEEDRNGFISVNKAILIGYKGESKKAHIPKDIQIIGAYAFAHNCQIQHVSCAENLTAVSDYSFYKCSDLRKVCGMGSVKRVGAHAFEDCYSLHEVPYFPMLSTLGDYAFAGCRNIRAFVFPQAVSEIPIGICRNCSGVLNIYLPRQLRRINAYAFQGCRGIKSLELPDTVTFIGRAAFLGCAQLQYLSFPENLEKIEEDVMSGCGIALSVKTKNWNPSIGFLGTNRNIDIILENSKDETKAVLFYSDNWQRFKRGGKSILSLALFNVPDSIDYTKYDLSFEYLKYTEDMVQFAINRLLFPAELSYSNQIKYKAFIERHITDAVQVILKRHMKNAAVFLCEEKLFSSEALEHAIELANESDDTDTLMIFMNHKKKITCRDDVFDDMFKIE